MSLHFEFSDLLLVDHLRLHLSYGVANARTKKHLAEATGYTPREIEEAIRQMRLSGLLIASGPLGYWMASPDEMAQTIASLQGRLVSQYRTIRALRGALRAHRAIVEGQLGLGLVA